MTEDSGVREIAALFEDEYAHAILKQTSTQEMSVPELSDACEASVSTIYRRIERLQEHYLLAEQLHLGQMATTTRRIPHGLGESTSNCLREHSRSR